MFIHFYLNFFKFHELFDELLKEMIINKLDLFMIKILVYFLFKYLIDFYKIYLLLYYESIIKLNELKHSKLER